MTEVTPAHRRRGRRTTLHGRAAVVRKRFALFAGTVTFLVLAGSTFATASWVTSTSISGTVTAATTSATISGTTALDYTYQFGGAASTSPVIIKPILVSNTGTAPLNYTLGVSNVSASNFASSVKLSLWLQVAGACGTAVPGGATMGTLAAPPALPSGAASGAASSSFTLCAATSLNTTVAATTGFTVTSTVSLNGQVGASSWVASVSQTLTQSSLTFCTQGAMLGGLLGYPVKFTLATPAGAGPFTYRVVLDATPTTIVKSAQSGSTITIQYANLSSYGSPVVLRMQASRDGFATVVSSFVQKVTYSPGVGGTVLPSVTCVAS